MADYSKKTVGDNRHLSRLTSARFIQFDGSIAQPVNVATPRSLLRVIVATKGTAFIIRTGTRVVATFGTTSAEGTYDFGEYLENGLTIDVTSGSGSVNVAFDV